MPASPARPRRCRAGCWPGCPAGRSVGRQRRAGVHAAALHRWDDLECVGGAWLEGPGKLLIKHSINFCASASSDVDERGAGPLQGALARCVGVVSLTWISFPGNRRARGWRALIQINGAGAGADNVKPSQTDRHNRRQPCSSIQWFSPESAPFF
ncbi:protein of unknown function [Ectopseudomonas oleovorans]|nr:protein of unknown function [Pseudomonas oleovorans]